MSKSVEELKTDKTLFLVSVREDDPVDAELVQEYTLVATSFDLNELVQNALTTGVELRLHSTSIELGDQAVLAIDKALRKVYQEEISEDTEDEEENG